MSRVWAVLLFHSLLILPLVSAAERPSRWRAVWRISQAMLVGSEAADAASSWGKAEGNPLVNTGQRFSCASLAIKVAALGGGMAAQEYLVRKDPRKTRLFAIANMAGAGLLGIVSAHNVGVPRPPE